MNAIDPKRLLRGLFDAAVSSVQPACCLATHLPLAGFAETRGRVVVVGAGKAVAAMAQAVERLWEGPIEGLVVIPYGGRPYGSGSALSRIEVIEASHPVPDQASLVAARRILEKVAGLGADDHVLCLLSGGGSALMTLPAAGITLADKQAINQALLAAGAAINEINCVRKHLSAIKGGKLALACGAARLTTLAISDVPGDDPSIIASGPTVPDGTGIADALDVLQRYKVAVPRRVSEFLRSSVNAETPKPDVRRRDQLAFRVIANPRRALDAAADAARAAGVVPILLGDWLAGEAFAVARALADIARNFSRADAARPCVLLSGGEPGVTVRGSGRGGRCTELLLGLGIALGGAPGIWALAAGTDGIDGTGPHAGAVIGPDSLARLNASGIDPCALQKNNDSATAFERLGDLIVTGPTGTNVSDFRAVLIGQG